MAGYFVLLVFLFCVIGLGGTKGTRKWSWDEQD